MCGSCVRRVMNLCYLAARYTWLFHGQYYRRASPVGMCTRVTYAWDIVHRAPKRIMLTSCIPRGCLCAYVHCSETMRVRVVRRAIDASRMQSTLGNSARYVACPRVCMCRSSSAIRVPVGRVPRDVDIARVGANRDVADGRVRLERVPQPHTGCCFALHLLAQGCCCAFCKQRNCCDPRWELARASGTVLLCLCAAGVWCAVGGREPQGSPGACAGRSCVKLVPARGAC
eukprot:2343439-Prymnesium_polylepis.1